MLTTLTMLKATVQEAADKMEFDEMKRLEGEGHDDHAAHADHVEGEGHADHVEGEGHESSADSEKENARLIWKGRLRCQ